MGQRTGIHALGSAGIALVLLVAQSGSDAQGGVSNLNPAMILYGFEPDELGIRYMQVDCNVPVALQ
jgi:hypothetical protein